MSDDVPPRFTSTGPELQPEVRWLGWLLMAAAVVVALVVAHGLLGPSTSTATVPGDTDASGVPGTPIPVTLSCVAPGRGATSPSTGNGESFSDVDAVSEGTTPADSTTDLAVATACNQVRSARVTHALEWGLVDVALLGLGVGIALVRPRRRASAPAA